jgi:Flp pilus assembly protein TadG
MQTSTKSKRRDHGGSMVEVALLAPWIFFLFVGIFDFGFYAFDAICIQNAARVAALQTAVNSSFTAAQLQSLACTAATLEMNRIPNIQGIPAGCGARPLIVTQQALNNGTTPPCADCGIDSTAKSSLVTVTYQSSLFVPIPGFVTNQLNLTRASEVRMVIP